MDFSILYGIQNIRCDFLDQSVLVLSKIAGDYGHLWLIAGVLLCIFKKTRKSGIAVLVSYGLVFLTGQLLLKDLIARPRPCHLDETIELIVKRPSSFSCPSTHSAWAFAAATAVFMHHRKPGIGVYALAAIIGFSRLYLFVHVPTDVLFGAALGVFCGFAAVKLVDAVWKKVTRKKPAEGETEKGTLQ